MHNPTCLGFKPFVELHNVWMLHALEHLHFVVDHLFVALDVLLEDDLDSAFSQRSVSLTDDAICTSAEGLSEAVFRSGNRISV
jgi:hypothetical protein